MVDNELSLKKKETLKEIEEIIADANLVLEVMTELKHDIINRETDFDYIKLLDCSGLVDNLRYIELF